MIHNDSCLYSGYKLENYLDLLRYVEDHKLPPTIDEFEDDVKSYAIPLKYAEHSTGLSPVHAICLTAKRQVMWIGQLMKSKVKYVLHVDGKHKLHHGKWLLLTVGPHVLRQDGSKLKSVRARMNRIVVIHSDTR